MFDRIKKMIASSTDAMIEKDTAETVETTEEAFSGYVAETAQEACPAPQMPTWENLSVEAAAAAHPEEPAVPVPLTDEAFAAETEQPAFTEMSISPAPAAEEPASSDCGSGSASTGAACGSTGNISAQVPDDVKPEPEKKPEKIKPEPVGFYTDKNSFFVNAAFWLLILSVAFMLIGSSGLWRDSYSLKTLLLLPMGSAVLFALCVRFLGKKTLWLSVIPFIGGALYFFLYAKTYLPFPSPFITGALCLGALAVYFLTVIFKIRNRWWLLISFCVLFFYRLLVEDLGLLGNYSFVFISFSDGIREMAVLCMLLSVALLAIGLKRRMPEPEFPELPKMKTPHTVIKKPEAGE